MCHGLVNLGVGAHIVGGGIASRTGNEQSGRLPDTVAVLRHVGEV